MFKFLLFTLGLLLVVSCTGSDQQTSKVTADENLSAKVCEYIIGDFQKNLKAELMSAMADGGPVEAVNVCSQKAQEIADSFSQIPGVSIRRVSLKQRNKSFMPDDLETITLSGFEFNQSSDPQTFAKLFQIDSLNMAHFRYIKEIKAGAMCMKCHGNPDTFSEGLKAALAEKYPDDPATGYKAGDSRGAFSVTLTYPEVQKTVDSLIQLIN